jgi:hypothetical protein
VSSLGTDISNHSALFGFVEGLAVEAFVSKDFVAVRYT